MSEQTKTPEQLVHFSLAVSEVRMLQEIVGEHKMGREYSNTDRFADKFYVDLDKVLEDRD
jgi:hypothetical protein